MSTPKEDPTENTSNKKTSGKGRPTPKRRDAEKEKIRPLVPPDRKEAKRQERKQRNLFYEKQRQALLTGDERYLPLRDKGPVRRWVRDWVDARFSWCEFMFPIIIVLLFASLFFQSDQRKMLFILISLYTVFITSFIDAIIATIYLKRKLNKRFTRSEIPPRIGFYAFMRMLVLPVMRSPKPLRKHGDWPS
ncbi:DUF3043 domain-containing protein [Actinomyces sp. zg-332]|uniref:DUF3043 domain-containing protein n=1 Tax=Actinomyces sp. zg-332 TaxID=2708340 RepID=UPI0014217254|nr:DUF3043 domain-containing protein [Actinomyces sp. zg-332]QPK93840.1 DUF3043 domain-containing protein [Actinomyces sp. zg-332]